MATEDKVLGPITLPRSLANKAKTASNSTGIDRGQAIPRQREYLNSTVATVRNSRRSADAIRALYHKDGTVSSGVISLVQVANSGYKVKAVNRITGRFDPEGTKVVHAIVQGMDTLSDYSQGFTSKPTMSSFISAALKEVVIEGACSTELVLNKFRLPDRLQMVPYGQLEFESDGKGGHYPVQQVSGGDPIPLDIPNFFISELLKDADRIQADSFLEGAANTAIYYNEFIEDMRRVMRSAGHSRIVAKLDTEKVIEAAKSSGATTDAEVLEFMEDMKDQVSDLLSGIEPEEALVSYDVVDFETSHAERDKSDYTTLLQAIANMTATSLKSSPSVLGMRGQGSQSLSNTESLVFIKIAKVIQGPVEDVLSRALTLATRLFGLDVYCKFKFNEINLRPEDELSAFRSMQEDRIMQKLSLGLISDEEAAWEMGCFPLDMTTYKPLSGTHFHQKSPLPSTNTNADKKGAQEAAIESDAPSSAGGKDNKNRKDGNGT